MSDDDDDDDDAVSRRRCIWLPAWTIARRLSRIGSD